MSVISSCLVAWLRSFHRLWDNFGNRFETWFAHKVPPVSATLNSDTVIVPEVLDCVRLITVRNQNPYWFPWPRKPVNWQWTALITIPRTLTRYLTILDTSWSKPVTCWIEKTYTIMFPCAIIKQYRDDASISDGSSWKIWKIRTDLSCKFNAMHYDVIKW